MSSSRSSCLHARDSTGSGPAAVVEQLHKTRLARSLNWSLTAPSCSVDTHRCFSNFRRPPATRARARLDASVDEEEDVGPSGCSHEGLGGTDTPEAYGDMYLRPSGALLPKARKPGTAKAHTVAAAGRPRRSRQLGPCRGRLAIRTFAQLWSRRRPPASSAAETGRLATPHHLPKREQAHPASFGAHSAIYDFREPDERGAWPAESGEDGVPCAPFTKTC